VARRKLHIPARDSDGFIGIAPRFGDNLPRALATTAEATDVSDGQINAIKQNVLTDAGSHDLYPVTEELLHIWFFNSAWIVDHDKWFLEWNINNIPLLIQLTDGVPQKQIGATLVDLGQDAPAAPVTALNGVGVLTGTYLYQVTTLRNVGGSIDESGPSPASIAVTADTNKILVTKPTGITDGNVTHWNIYRTSTEIGTFQFVAQVAIGTGTFDDNIADLDLGAALPTQFTSLQGNVITFAKPAVTFDGLARQLYNSMLFGWNGPTLYWSEPGLPDAWPAFYFMNFPSNIRNALVYAETLVVLTEKDGPWQVNGSDPEILTQSRQRGNKQSSSTAATLTPGGIVYLSDSGLTLFNLSDSVTLSDELFTEKWFTDNVEPLNSQLAENDGIVYLFHDAGILVMDARQRSALKFYTLPDIANGPWSKPDEGSLYYVDSVGIQQHAASASNRTWTWKTGDLPRGGGADREFKSVEVRGSGTVTLTIDLDGVQVATKALSFADPTRNRVLKFPEESIGRSCQIEVTGTGTVKQMILETDIA
jgi:hypothetical protein